jgi:hypothetical protein
MQQGLRVVIVGGFVMLLIEALFLVGGHAAPLPMPPPRFWSQRLGARYPQEIAQTK